MKKKVIIFFPEMEKIKAFFLCTRMPTYSYIYIIILYAYKIDIDVRVQSEIYLYNVTVGNATAYYNTIYSPVHRFQTIL